jgi:tetratricopeptide (TPR) repeat protein
VRCLAEMGEFAEGRILGEEGMRIAEELEHPLSLTQMCVGLGLLNVRQGEIAQAIPILERGLEVGRRWNVSLYVATLSTAVGCAYVHTGRVAEGLALLKTGVDEAAAKNAILGHSVRLAWLSEGHLLAGELEVAWRAGEEALALSRRYDEKGQNAWNLHLLGEIAARRDPENVEGAEHYYLEAMTIAESLGMFPALAQCQLGRGELHVRAGRRETGSAYLTAAAALCRQMRMTGFEERAERGLARLKG